MSLVLSPSDIKQASKGLSRLVGGRVLQSDQHYLVLADFSSTTWIRVSGLPATTPGDLAVCEIEARPCDDGHEWALLRLVEVHKCPEPPGRGEFLRLQEAGRGQSLAARAKLLRVVRDYFDEEGFLEVTTPTFTASPGLDPHVASLAAVNRGSKQDFLITSPEFHMKRLLSAGMPRIYQLARCFRAEEQGAWHEPEFTLLEWYRSFAGFEVILNDTEELVRRAFTALSSDMKYDGGTVAPRFHRMTVRDAFENYCQSEDPILLAEEDPEKYFRLLVEKVEPGLASLGRPVFLTHYPLSQSGLARTSPDDPSVAERFELYVGAVEVSNGYGELTDPSQQRLRFQREQERRRKAGEVVYPIDEQFLAALEQGLPPCSGNALGLDRLASLALGRSDIQSVYAFTDSER